MNFKKNPGHRERGRHVCRGRFIVPTADLSASGKPTTSPGYFVKSHHRAHRLSEAERVSILRPRARAGSRPHDVVACINKENLAGNGTGKRAA